MKVESHELPLDVEVLGPKKLVNVLVEPYEVTAETGNTQTRYKYHQLRFLATDGQEGIDKAVSKYVAGVVEQEKDDKLNRLRVTTGLGKVFYADPTSRVDIGDAIGTAEAEGIASTVWKLAEEFEGSRYAVVTLDELKEARKLALEAKGSIVGAV